MVKYKQFMDQMVETLQRHIGHTVSGKFLMFVFLSVRLKIFTRLFTKSFYRPSLRTRTRKRIRGDMLGEQGWSMVCCMDLDKVDTCGPYVVPVFYSVTSTRDRKSFVEGGGKTSTSIGSCPIETMTGV